MNNKWCNEKPPNNTNFNSYDFLKITFGWTIKDKRTLCNHQFCIGVPYDMCCPLWSVRGFLRVFMWKCSFPFDNDANFAGRLWILLKMDLNLKWSCQVLDQKSYGWSLMNQDNMCNQSPLADFKVFPSQNDGFWESMKLQSKSTWSFEPLEQYSYGLGILDEPG